MKRVIYQRFLTSRLPPSTVCRCSSASIGPPIPLTSLTPPISPSPSHARRLATNQGRHHAAPAASTLPQSTTAVSPTTPHSRSVIPPTIPHTDSHLSHSHQYQQATLGEAEWREVQRVVRGSSALTHSSQSPLSPPQSRSPKSCPPSSHASLPTSPKRQRSLRHMDSSYIAFMVLNLARQEAKDAGYQLGSLNMVQAHSDQRSTNSDLNQNSRINLNLDMGDKTYRYNNSNETNSVSQSLWASIIKELLLDDRMNDVVSDAGLLENVIEAFSIKMKLDGGMLSEGGRQVVHRYGEAYGEEVMNLINFKLSKYLTLSPISFDRNELPDYIIHQIDTMISELQKKEIKKINSISSIALVFTTCKLYIPVLMTALSKLLMYRYAIFDQANGLYPSPDCACIIVNSLANMGVRDTDFFGCRLFRRQR
eukprot:GHVN01021192.1.p1 GENE.GHVN01021192.1~~GHVN01021192.1.p1  ORF type:complete len:423 (+),score=110.20 GHVN01021192.1:261-1529(+)